jgi:hypothetical protein
MSEFYRLEYLEEHHEHGDPLPLVRCQSPNHIHAETAGTSHTPVELSVHNIRRNERRTTTQARSPMECDGPGSVGSQTRLLISPGDYMLGDRKERDGRPAPIVLEALHDLETVSRPEDAESDTLEPIAAHGTRPAVVTLLQSTLRSSQSEIQRVSTSWVPISGHWAVEIRGEVFELNRATTGLDRRKLFNWKLSLGHTIPSYLHQQSASVKLLAFCRRSG